MRLAINAFEFYADDHHLAKLRRDHPFLGPYYMKYHFYEECKQSPWSYSDLMKRDPVEMVARIKNLASGGTAEMIAQRKRFKQLIKEQKAAKAAAREAEMRQRIIDRQRARDPFEPAEQSTSQDPSSDPSMA
jgi:hypothetical protein